MKFKYKYKFLIMLAVILFTVIIQIKLNNTSKEEMMLKKYDLSNLSVEEMVVKLDKNTEDKKINAKITAKELIIEYQNEEFRYLVSEDLFYISFAPYINGTHPCSIHNLVSCNSEMKNLMFDVKIYTEKNDIFYDDKIKSNSNGFIGMWLPKNNKFTIEVRYNDLFVKDQITTFSSSNTCVTTPLQLK